MSSSQYPQSTKSYEAYQTNPNASVVNPGTSNRTEDEPRYAPTTTTTTTTSISSVSPVVQPANVQSTTVATGNSRPDDLQREFSYGVTPAALKAENAHQWSETVIADIDHINPPVTGTGTTSGVTTNPQSTTGSTMNTISNTANQAATQAKDTMNSMYNAAANAISNTTATTNQGATTAPTTTERISQAASSGASAVSGMAGTAYNTVANALSPSTSTQTTGRTSTVVPEVVRESQDLAHTSPEASAVPTAVANKNQMENELLSTVSTSPVTAGGQNPIMERLTNAFQGTSLTGGVAGGTSSAQTTTSTVPPIVQESQARAHESPEASGIPSAVVQKKEMEDQLLSEVNTTSAYNSTSQTAANYAAQARDTLVSAAQTVQQNSGPVQSAMGSIYNAAVNTASALANQAREGAAAVYNSAGAEIDHNTTAVDDATVGRAQATTSDTPAVVSESQMAAGFGQEASGVPSSVIQKQAVEDELLSKVDMAPAAATGGSRPQAHAMDTSEILNRIPGGFTE